MPLVERRRIEVGFENRPLLTEGSDVGDRGARPQLESEDRVARAPPQGRLRWPKLTSRQIAW